MIMMKKCDRCDGTRRIWWPEAGMLQDCPACKPTDAAPFPTPAAGYVELRLLDASGAETCYPGYARVRILRDSSAWDIANGESSNKNSIQFPESTRGNVCTVCYVEAAADGNVFPRARIGPLVIHEGITLTFAPGALRFTI